MRVVCDDLKDGGWCWWLRVTDRHNIEDGKVRAIIGNCGVTFVQHHCGRFIGLLRPTHVARTEIMVEEIRRANTPACNIRHWTTFLISVAHLLESACH